MGVMDKFISYMKLNGEQDDDGYYDDDSYDEDEPIETKTPNVVRKMNTAREEAEEMAERPVRRAPSGNNKITQMRQTTSKRMPSASGMEVCVMRPVSVEEAHDITHTLLDNRTVVLNLEGIDTNDAQRIVDFASGSCYALGGKMQKISFYIFIITPASVDISGDSQDMFEGAMDSTINGVYN